MSPSERLVAFTKAMMVLGETFNEPVSAVRIEAYSAALNDLDENAVLAAMHQCLRSSKFFPRPADIRELAQGGPRSDRADLAWGELITAVKRIGWCGFPVFDDPAVMPTIRAVWGSWTALCETLPADGPELVGWMKQFKSAYQSVDARAEREVTLNQLPTPLAQTLKQIADGKGMP